ncbi:hypothetical protein OCH239_16400 [Roseivivax halodurans JCM 10272]|uniref:Uncharacterized protein n=1 Tax=Roseivivax halodurans JCM 10272 TaxID=1449350 RepID=X7EK00_9RHOB|nr:hypothetical protein OCH239_16400 [Roseivivax halodurans JCM 10272]
MKTLTVGGVDYRSLSDTVFRQRKGDKLDKNTPFGLESER